MAEIVLEQVLACTIVNVFVMVLKGRKMVLKKLVLGLLFVLLFSLTAHADAASQQDKAEETPGTDHSSMETADTQGTKREFKDLVIYEPYEYLNSEITGDPLREAASGRAPLQGTGVRGRERPGL